MSHYFLIFEEIISCKQVNELSAELAEEQATSAASAEKIEQEMTEKQQIESQLVNLKTRYQSIENEKQQLELDLAYSISEVGGEANSADEFNDDSVYKWVARFFKFL